MCHLQYFHSIFDGPQTNVIIIIENDKMTTKSRYVSSILQEKHSSRLVIAIKLLFFIGINPEHSDIVFVSYILLLLLIYSVAEMTLKFVKLKTKRLSHLITLKQ